MNAAPSGRLCIVNLKRAQVCPNRGEENENFKHTKKPFLSSIVFHPFSKMVNNQYIDLQYFIKDSYTLSAGSITSSSLIRCLSKISLSLFARWRTPNANGKHEDRKVSCVC